MITMRLVDIAKNLDARLVGDDVTIQGVSINSREVHSAQLFIAIKGDHFDAHDFIPSLGSSAAAVLVDHEVVTDLPQVIVADTKLALANLASLWRQQLATTVVGITGSNGKTTLKEMLAAIVSIEKKVYATQGNLNNDIGMPLTLLQLSAKDEVAVIEMGANHFDEIAFLTHCAKPDIAVINNAGPAHLEGFGDVDGVARAKGEIFAGLTSKGVAVINADDDYAEYWKSLNANREIVTFGFNPEANLSGDYQGNGTLVIQHGELKETVELPLLGRHNALNALAACALASVLKISLATMKQGLEQLKVVKGRLHRRTGISDSCLIDDSYNANPASMAAAINVLAEAKGKKILVIGDMGELGGDITATHATVGEQAKEQSIDALYCLGDFSKAACERFGDVTKAYQDLAPLMVALQKEIDANTTVLVKGSRSAKMERVVKKLLKQTRR